MRVIVRRCGRRRQQQTDGPSTGKTGNSGLRNARAFAMETYNLANDIIYAMRISYCYVPTIL